VVLPLRTLDRHQHASFGREVASLANYYTCTYRPAIAAMPPARAAQAVAAALAALRDDFDLLDLNALPADEPLYASLPAAVRAVGLWQQRYTQFGNWYEAMPAVPADYLAARPSTLRNTIARKGKRLAQAGDARFAIFHDAAPAALAAYDAIYAASWKQPEPYPDFIAGLARAAAEAGVLRLGVCWIGEAPAAAQLWLTGNGKATIFKLAHDERFKDTSVGTLLTWHMLQAAIADDGVREVDYGRGDHPYKQDWLNQRRERGGLLVFNPGTPAGLLAAARHLGGGWLKRLFRGDASNRRVNRASMAAR
jgi:CelD/BcsL family acetyltransferase involved in cellulose biosynthesis